jgi:hypothetical protein
MNYWDSVGRWINTLLVFIVGILAFDTLFRMLRANDDNVIVGLVRVLALVFLVPFKGMFGDQDYVLTALFAVLGYALLAGIALGVLRALQASRAQQAPGQTPQLTAETPSTPQQAAAPRRPDAEQRQGGGRADDRQRGARTAAPPAPADERRRNGRRQQRAAADEQEDTRRRRLGARNRAAGQRRAGRPDPERSG